MGNGRGLFWVKGLIVFFLLIATGLFADIARADGISGTGFGKTLDDAKKEALAELSQNIRVEVKSEFTNIQIEKNKNLDELKKKVIHLKSNLPILGVQFSDLASRDGFMVEATLTAASTLLYEKELAQTADIILKNLQSLKTASTNSEKAGYLKSILTRIDQYYSLRVVAQFLKSEKIPEIPVTAEDISTRLAALEKKADSLDFGVQVLSKSIHADKIYIYPPTPENSSEVTQFGSAIKDRLARNLKIVATPDHALCYLTGSYKILKDGIELTCHLTDKDNRAISTALVYFLPQAYAGYATEPVSLDFEKLIQAGHVVTGDFRVDLKTEKGKQDLLYKRGDTMKTLVKMNKPGYFYLVSHNFKKSNYSYIINFTTEEGNRKFVYHVNGDDVNKWVELGEFEVVPPFGVETLQLIASTEDLVDSVPATFHDSKTDLFTIESPDKKNGKTHVASNPEKALFTTRGLIIKKKTATSEAVLVFTSMDKNSL